MEIPYKEFTNQILHREKHYRPHKVSGSLGVYDAYKYIRKNKWFDIKGPVSEKDFYSIIRTCNKALQDELLKGNAITLPYKLGTLELLKREAKIELVDDKIVTNKKINWEATLKLWHNDIESRRKKTLIRFDESSVIFIKYNKRKACYNNLTLFSFKPNKKLNIAIKKLYSEGLIDAMQVDYGME